MRKTFACCCLLLAVYQAARAQKEPLHYTISFARFKQFYNAKQGDSIYNMFAVTVKAALSREKTRDLIENLQQQYGTIGAAKVASGDAQGLIYEAQFSKGETINISYALNAKNELAGLFFSPAGNKAAQNPAVNNFIVKGSLGNEVKGTLELPPSNEALPLVIIVAGSGPTDRDGNNPLGVSANSYKMVAACLQNAGIASLRYDKTGIAASADPKISQNLVRFETMVDDLVLLIRKARADKRFSKIILFGHSEGSLVSILAAAKEPVAGLISVSGPARPANEILVEQMTASNPGIKEELEATLQAIREGKVVQPVDATLQQMFPASVQPYLGSWMQYDPRKALTKLNIPILILQGTNDLQVGTEEANALKKAQPAASLTILQGMTHTLKTASSDREENLKTYSDPDLPLTEGLCSSLISFINQKK